MEYLKYFNVTGVINTTTFDSGLSSSAEAKKRLKSIIINVTKHTGQKIQGWLEREKVCELPDYCIDTQELTAADKHPKTMNKLNEIPVGVDMPIGSTFKIAVECGATKIDLFGAYRYEIIA
ncbi:unnamed protein product [marine sediment metagenome]|uniref:Uncharacterized protein n=1 Tax=marine sediment metagenome TaxID=412755 RepID=X1DWD5_9ZZZZ